MATHPVQDVTRVLRALNRGESHATEELLPLVYDQLRRLADRRMARERAGHTLQATALVHEAFLRLVRDADARWENRGHFFAAAAIAMRRLLVERARKRRLTPDKTDPDHVACDRVANLFSADPADMLALDEALAALEQIDPRMAEVVMLRFFAGLEIEQVAEVVGVSPSTVKREWACAKAWLYQRLTGEGRCAADPRE